MIASSKTLEFLQRTDNFDPSSLVGDQEVIMLDPEEIVEFVKKIVSNHDLIYHPHYNPDKDELPKNEVYCYYNTFVYRDANYEIQVKGSCPTIQIGRRRRAEVEKISKASTRK